MDEVVMVTIPCPWCEAPLSFAHADALRCEDCRIEVEIDPAPAAEVALAA
jgi:hypothetical protein